MARSHAIWVVTSELYQWPLAAFTVKGELSEWLRRQSAEDLAWMHVWRMVNPISNCGGRLGALTDTTLPEEQDIDVLAG